MKKIICIYLALVMVLTGCGQARRLTGGSDTIIESQDENKNGKSDNNSGNAIVPQNPTPTPTAFLVPSPTPPTGGKDENKKAERTLSDTLWEYKWQIVGAVVVVVVATGVCIWQWDAIAGFVLNLLPVGNQLLPQLPANPLNPPANPLNPSAINQYYCNLVQLANIPPQAFTDEESIDQRNERLLLLIPQIMEQLPQAQQDQALQVQAQQDQALQVQAQQALLPQDQILIIQNQAQGILSQYTITDTTLLRYNQYREAQDQPGFLRARSRLVDHLTDDASEFISMYQDQLDPLTIALILATLTRVQDIGEFQALVPSMQGRDPDLQARAYDALALALAETLLGHAFAQARQEQEQAIIQYREAQAQDQQALAQQAQTLQDQALQVQALQDQALQVQGQDRELINQAREQLALAQAQVQNHLIQNQTFALALFARVLGSITRDLNRQEEERDQQHALNTVALDDRERVEDYYAHWLNEFIQEDIAREQEARQNQLELQYQVLLALLARQAQDRQDQELQALVPLDQAQALFQYQANRRQALAQDQELQDQAQALRVQAQAPLTQVSLRQAYVFRLQAQALQDQAQALQDQAQQAQAPPTEAISQVQALQDIIIHTQQAQLEILAPQNREIREELAILIVRRALQDQINHFAQQGHDHIDYSSFTSAGESGMFRPMIDLLAQQVLYRQLLLTRQENARRRLLEYRDLLVNQFQARRDQPLSRQEQKLLEYITQLVKSLQNQDQLDLLRFQVLLARQAQDRLINFRSPYLPRYEYSYRHPPIHLSSILHARNVLVTQHQQEQEALQDRQAQELLAFHDRARLVVDDNSYQQLLQALIGRHCQERQDQQTRHSRELRELRDHQHSQDPKKVEELEQFIPLDFFDQQEEARQNFLNQQTQDQLDILVQQGKARKDLLAYLLQNYKEFLDTNFVN